MPLSMGANAHVKGQMPVIQAEMQDYKHLQVQMPIYRSNAGRYAPIQVQSSHFGYKCPSDKQIEQIKGRNAANLNNMKQFSHFKG